MAGGLDVVATDTLLLAFVANNPSNDLLVVPGRRGTAPGGIVWSDHRVVKGERSKTAPGLVHIFDDDPASHNELISISTIAFLASNDTQDVLVCQSTDDGVRWSGNRKVNQRSKSAPAITALPLSELFGGPTFVLAFVANNDKNDLIACTSKNGLDWSDNRLVNQQSPFAPALDLTHLGFTMAFVANNSSHDLLVCTSTDGVGWSEHAVVGQQSQTTPALAEIGGRVVLAFVADNESHDLLTCTSTDGITWSGNSRVEQQSKFAPSLSAIGDILVMTFVANNDSNDLLYCTSTDGVSWSDNALIGEQSRF